MPLLVWRHKIWTRRLEYWDNKRWLIYIQNIEQLDDSWNWKMIELENNKYFQQWLRRYQNENMPNDGKGIPPDREELTTGSPSVTSTSVPSMEVATMDTNVQDCPVKPQLKCHLISWKNSRNLSLCNCYKKTRKKRLSDLNLCKTH